MPSTLRNVFQTYWGWAQHMIIFQMAFQPAKPSNEINRPFLTFLFCILLPDLTFDNLILLNLTQHRLWNNFALWDEAGLRVLTWGQGILSEFQTEANKGDKLKTIAQQLKLYRNLNQNIIAISTEKLILARLGVSLGRSTST